MAIFNSKLLVYQRVNEGADFAAAGIYSRVPKGHLGTLQSMLALRWEGLVLVLPDEQRRPEHRGAFGRGPCSWWPRIEWGLGASNDRTLPMSHRSGWLQASGQWDEMFFEFKDLATYHSHHSCCQQ